MLDTEPMPPLFSQPPGLARPQPWPLSLFLSAILCACESVSPGTQLLPSPTGLLPTCKLSDIIPRPTSHTPPQLPPSHSFRSSFSKSHVLAAHTRNPREPLRMRSASVSHSELCLLTHHLGRGQQAHSIERQMVTTVGFAS